jgi:hypothetical protein
MEEIIFVDSGAWFAAFVPNDAHHAAARRILEATQTPLVTSDYVLDETLTLYRARGEGERAASLAEAILDERICRLLWVDRSDVLQANAIFHGYSDKAWSFTDCVSYVLMQRHGIRRAFSFDDHFRQFGWATVVP